MGHYQYQYQNPYQYQIQRDFVQLEQRRVFSTGGHVVVLNTIMPGPLPGDWLSGPKASALIFPHQHPTPLPFPPPTQEAQYTVLQSLDRTVSGCAISHSPITQPNPGGEVPYRGSLDPVPGGADSDISIIQHSRCIESIPSFPPGPLPCSKLLSAQFWPFAAALQA